MSKITALTTNGVSVHGPFPVMHPNARPVGCMRFPHQTLSLDAANEVDVSDARRVNAAAGGNKVVINIGGMKHIQ